MTIAHTTASEPIVASDMASYAMQHDLVPVCQCVLGEPWVSDEANATHTTEFGQTQ